MLQIAGGIILALVLIAFAPVLLVGAILLLYFGVTHWWYSLALLIVVLLWARYTELQRLDSGEDREG